MSRITIKIAAILLLLVMVTGNTSCQAEEWAVEETLSFQSVKMTLWLSAETVTPEDTLAVKVQVSNMSDEEIQYTMWNSGDPPVYLRLEQPYGDIITLRAPDEPEIVQPAVTFGSLGPGEAVEREVQWDITLPVDATVIAAPNGTYTVTAAFFPGRQIEQPEPEPLRLAYPVQVTGSTDLIAAERAEQFAFTLASVQRWVAGHTGVAVAREQKGTYTVNIGGEWQEADQELYKQALTAGESPSIVLTGGEIIEWEVRFATKFGFSPSEMTVILHAETSEVLSIRPDLEAELQGGVVATFQMGNSQFRVFVTNPETIQQLYQLQRGESQANIPNGPLLRGPGAGMHNIPWSWHLDPELTEMAEMTIEVCDGTPEFVEEDLEYWLNQVGQYCPWSARLVDITDYRS